MNPSEPIDTQIEAAIASGELSATRGLGRPMGKLDPDPMWWVKQLLRRERATDGLADIVSGYDRATESAIAANNLDEARSILAVANEAIAAWNAEVAEEFRVDARNEIWLLTERENARR